MDAFRHIRFYALSALFLFIICSACRKNENSTRHPSHDLPRGVTIVHENNGVISTQSLLFNYQDIHHPSLERLKTDENLEAVVSSGGTELEKMRLLRDWVSNQWESGMPAPYPAWDAEAILSEIRSGKTRGFCAQYGVVLVQAAISLGWQARYLAIASELKPRGGHLTVEIWSNTHNRWVVMDPHYCVDFEKDGIPLSALDIHECLVKNETSEINLNFGKDMRKKSPSQNMDSDQMLSLYYHLAVYMRNDHVSQPLSFWNRRQEYLGWQDSITDGRKDIFTLFTSDDEEFNFPLNQVEIRLSQGRGNGPLTCYFRSNMPAAKALYIRLDQGDWVSPDMVLSLDRLYGSFLTYPWSLHYGENRLEAKMTNRLGVEGPIAEITLIKE